MSNVLEEIRVKQRELDGLGEVFQGLRTFVLELRLSTKGKQFDVVNSFAWESALACSRMIVIDLAAWVDSLLPPRPQKKRKPEVGWLRRHLRGGALQGLSAKKERADAAAAMQKIAAPPDVADMVDAVMQRWEDEGKNTRRNWWDTLSGGADGRPYTVDGKEFPVLAAAQRRQGKPVTRNAVQRSARETPPPVRETGRWPARR